MITIYADAMLTATRMEKDFLHDLKREEEHRRRWKLMTRKGAK